MKNLKFLNHSFIFLIPFLLFFLVPDSYSQDDEIESALKSIWPDKDVKVIKVKDTSVPGVTLTNYGAVVLRDGYEYGVAINVFPDKVPADITKLRNMKPVDSSQYEIKDVEPPVWITIPKMATYFNPDGTTRKNKYIIQHTSFRCGNLDITTAIEKDSGTSEYNQQFNDPNSSTVTGWNTEMLPRSKEFAKRASSAICGGGCSASEVAKFYKEFLSVNQSSLASMGVQFDERYNKIYKEGKQKAFVKYPLECPQQTKQAMLGMIRSGFDAPDVMWRITASKNSFQDTRGTPYEYGEFIKNLSGGLGNNIDPVVRRFRHYPRMLDMQYLVGKKMDKPMRDILMHIVVGQVNKISRRITDNAIDAASYVMIDENKESLFDPAKAKYYIDLFDFTHNSLEKSYNYLKKEPSKREPTAHEAVLDYADLVSKKSKIEKLGTGVGMIKEALFFLPELIKLYEIQLEYNFVSQTFDELQTSFPDVRKGYEEALLRLNLVRQGMRDGTATVKRLQEKNKQYTSIDQWPPEDQKTINELTGTWNRNWSLLAELTKAHGVLFEELKEKRDALILTWYLLGYPEKDRNGKDLLPPMEVIY